MRYEPEFEQTERGWMEVLWWLPAGAQGAGPQMTHTPLELEIRESC